MYIAIDRKTKNGAGIQNSSCGKSGIILRLKLVTSEEDDDAQDEESGLLYGTEVIKYLVSPWVGTNQIMYADLYFSSVPCAIELMKHGQRCISVIKTSTIMYHMCHH